MPPIAAAMRTGRLPQAERDDVGERVLAEVAERLGDRGTCSAGQPTSQPIE